MTAQAVHDLCLPIFHQLITFGIGTDAGEVETDRVVLLKIGAQRVKNFSIMSSLMPPINLLSPGLKGPVLLAAASDVQPIQGNETMRFP